jgi:hypothetical protein
MSTISDEQLALALAGLVVNEGDISLHIYNDMSVDVALAGLGGKGPDKDKPARVLWISDAVNEPVYTFWRLREAKKITPDCHVIFTGVKDCPDWADLVNIYGGLRFGSLFIMKVSPNTRPGACPSQRGMYIQ